MIRLFVFAALLAACGDNVSAIAATHYEAAEVTAWCLHDVRCGLIDDLATCLAVWPVRHDLSWLAAIDAGKIHYDAVQAKTCVDAIAGTSCVDSRIDRSSACDGITRGELRAGETCDFDAECISWLCEGGGLVDACFVGSCVGDEPVHQRPALGASCTQFSECLDGFCDAATAKCVPWLAAGAVCSESYQCATHWCSDEKCIPLPRTGEPCLLTGLDGSTFICGNMGDHCDPTTVTCVPDGLSADPCTASYECSPMYACTNGTCHLRPREGEACDPTYNDRDRECLGGECVGGICAGDKSKGESCMWNTECASEYCDATHVCAPAPICS